MCLSVQLKTTHGVIVTYLCLFFLYKQRVQRRWRTVWSDEDWPGGQRPPDQRRHGPGARADVQRQTHTHTAGHCLSQFTHTDRG